LIEKLPQVVKQKMMKVGKFQFGPRPQDLDNAKIIKLITYPDGGFIFGEGVLNEKSFFIKEGRGMCMYSRGGVYEGWWKANKRHGKGRSY
jgi:hypothetical protein